MLRATREREGKEAELLFLANNDGDVKTIGVSTIESLFRNIKFDNEGTEEDSILISMHHNCSEGDDLVANNFRYSASKCDCGSYGTF